MIDRTALRVFVYDEIATHGIPPSVAAIGDHFKVPPAVARAELASLKIGKTILVHPESGEIWMAGPFSAVETNYRVSAGNRAWWANCAWDMLGIPMVLGHRVLAHTRCVDCGEELTIECDPVKAPAYDAVVHFLVPARHWYDDIGFT